MPITPTNNNYLWGIAKQTDEATIPSVAAYSVAGYTGTWSPVYEERRVEVLDGSSVQGDISKGLTWWEGESEFPAYGDSLGRVLQSLYPTDTKTGAGPYQHAFSGLGGTQPWIALFCEWPTAAAKEFTFGRGQATAFGITASADETPARVRFAAMGQTPSVTAYTVTLADDLADGYFTLQQASSSIQLDFDTPNADPSVAATNVQNVTLNIDRSATPMPTADGTTVSNISAGKVSPSGTASLIWQSFDAFQATYFGSVAGTAASSVIVTGALDLNFVHTTQPTWALKFYVPAVQFKASMPVPNPAGEGLTMDVTLNIQKPSSGDHIVPTLTNSTVAAY